MTQAGSFLAEVTSMNTPHRFLTRWHRSRAAQAEGPSSMRFEVRPPSLRHAPDSLMNRIWFWLAAPAPLDAAPPTNRLPAVRLEFQAALIDISPARASELMQRIELARSLRELWHLRADVYGVVAVEYNQAEAESRLSDLNRHFPTRAPRSGFAPL